jgi:penicillin-binding protein 1A
MGLSKVNKKKRRKITRYALLAISSMVALFAFFIMSIHMGAWGRIPSKSDLSELNYQRATEVFTSDSVLIGKYYIFDRQPVAYEAFPDFLVDALVAIEDERFYEHRGVDYKSLFRVLIKTLLLQDASAGGGSTISQQLAKNLYPRAGSGKLRLAASKIREMLIAKKLEAIYSKEEIVEHYLNTVSFGDNTFGIESASLKFFSKRTNELNLEEAATLVGMLKATYGYNPRIFPENSLERRNLVLMTMTNNEYLSQEIADSVIQLPIELKYRQYDYNEGLAPYFREEVRKQLVAWAGTEKESGREYNIYTSGLKIYTTLNYEMQRMAETAMREHMSALQTKFEKSHGRNAPWIADKKLIDKTVRQSNVYKKLVAKGLSSEESLDSLAKPRPMTLTDWEGDRDSTLSAIDSIRHYMKFLNVGSLSIEPSTGAVQTWIGGIDFRHFKYDHVSQSKRQVGSTFKPIVYTAALEKGIDPCSYYSAQQVVYENLEGWSPGNTGDKEEIYLNYSMEEAISKSVNTVAVKVLEDTGIPLVLEQARKMGIQSTLPGQPSLALGTGAIGIDEMAGAYASYVNNGKPVKPYLITAIADRKDSVLQRFEPDLAQPPAYSAKTREIMLQFMKATVENGTAARLRTQYGFKNSIAGKTGTTQNNKDAWFVGIMPQLVHVSWVGLENHEIGFPSTALGQGANAALPLFALYLQKLNDSKEFSAITAASFPVVPDDVLELLDCEPVKKDGFFKRLFKNPNKKKTRKFRDTD